MALKHIHYKGSTLHISYTIINNHAKQNLAFLHGWGSNKELMILAFGKSFKDFNHIYLDLPGFGASHTDIFLDSYDYASIVDAFLREISVDGVLDSQIVAGHSFGGKISLLLGREIILLSSAGILLPKSARVRAKILMTKILNRILKTLGLKGLSFLRAKDAQNLTPLMYEIFKHVVNEDFSSHYASFKHSATIFWGREDTATPLKCYHKILELMTGVKAHILEGDHYFFLKQADLIERLYKNAN